MRAVRVGVVAAALLFVPVETGRGAAALPAALAWTSSGISSVTRNWEHRYRVDGKAWFVFWISRADVGAARMSRRQAGATVTMTFLGGSNPGRAPGSLNQWGYSLEQTDGTDARAFVVRSFPPSEPGDPEASLADGTEDALFGAACQTLDHSTGRASVTGIRVPPTMTFRSFSGLLDALSRHSRWKTMHVSPPSDARAGFFNAMQSALDDSIAAERSGSTRAIKLRRPYVYKGTVYDLTLNRVDHEAEGRLKGRFTYRNLTTGESADFSVIYGSDGELTGVPIEMSFAPSWWIRVQLTLDDSIDVPDEPSADSAVAAHIRELCARALDGDGSAVR